MSQRFFNSWQILNNLVDKMLNGKEQTARRIYFGAPLDEKTVGCLITRRDNLYGIK